MTLTDFHIKRCALCNKIVWRLLDIMVLYCFDKQEKVVHGECLEIVGWLDNSQLYRGCP